MTSAIILMTALWALKQFGALAGLGAVGRWLSFDPLWFSLVGSLITLAVGGASARLRPRSA
jgi:hypothetical protein